MLCTFQVWSQPKETSEPFHLSGVRIVNPDLLVLIDTILHMDSICGQVNIDYKISIKDTIIDGIQRYFISLKGMYNIDIDTVDVYGCLKYHNHNFFFENPFMPGLGIILNDNTLYFESQEFDRAIRDNIPHTFCAYYLGRMWILNREWDWGDKCGKYHYPIEILSVVRN